jgi:hypothetical protein
MLGEPEIGDLDMPICAEQQIFRFQVPVDDIQGM